jgi:hypothetical protein
MRLGWAIACGVLGGAALAWWLTPAETRLNPFSTSSRPTAGAAARAEAGQAPALYRWRDAQGVLHVAQQPPTDGQAYERVEIPQDRNIVPLGVTTEGD